MTCYFRHLQQFFQKAGIEITKENKSTVDRVIHSIVDVQYKDCSRTWKKVKGMIAKNEAALISKLKAALTDLN